MGSSKTIIAGTKLSQLDLNISSPCAGNGTCGKCKVTLKTTEATFEVLACQYTAETDCELLIPDPPVMAIQTESFFPSLPLNHREYPLNTYGIAVDVGTTTVVVFLEDLHQHRNIAVDSFLNPQKSFGADVVSRIQYASNPDGLKKLQQYILTEINTSILRLADTAQISTAQIERVCIVGNTTMLHILHGTDPSSLAFYPFDAPFLEQKTLAPQDLGLRMAEQGSITLLPSLSAYVGADIVAGIAASDMLEEEEYSLFLDIGTNGEMALGNKDQILCCATAAGPAFEGAKISCGLGGVAGAIHQYNENDYKTIDDQEPLGLCGSGLIDVVAVLLNSGKLPANGYIAEDVQFLEDHSLSLTPQDIREIQMAKGAIAAGIETLLKKAKISSSQLKKVYLAGGFGHSIQAASAARIGLIPKELEKKIIRTGNTAGLGARLFLHSQEFATRVETVCQKAETFDLSMDMDFNESFVMHMDFPQS